MALALLALTVTATHAVAQQFDPRIVGTWEWQSTEIEGQPIQTPATVGYTEQWEFTDDSGFCRYRNRHPQWQSTYSMSEILTEDERFIVTLAIVAFDSWLIGSLDEHALVLVDDPDAPHERWTFQRRGPVPTPESTLGALKAIYGY